MSRNALIEAAALYWRAFGKALRELEDGPHPGANLLTFHRNRMVSAQERLLALGLDLTDMGNPHVVPVPIHRHPKTKAEVRAWEAEIAIRSDEVTMCWSVTGVGTNVVYSAVGREALADALHPYLDEPSKVSRPVLLDALSEANLDITSLASALWLLEPTGPNERRVAELDAACLQRMTFALEYFPMMRNARTAKDASAPQSERTIAATILGGWSLANISLHGPTGGRLRSALGAQASARIRSRLLEELPAATHIAWEDMQPGEALRSTGDRRLSLLRRVAAILEQNGDEVALRRKVVSADAQDGGHHLIGDEDAALWEFEREESLRQDLGRLRAWVERADFSSHQRRVYELDMATNFDTDRIAQELGIEPATVRQHRKRYQDKLGKVAGA